MSPSHRDDLEQRLEALARRNPTMPADVEGRLRARLAAARSQARSARGTRRFPPLSPGAGGITIQVLLLVALVATTAWVVTTRDMPVLQGTWNRCAAPPSSASPAPSIDPNIAAAAARAMAHSRAAMAAAQSCSHTASPAAARPSPTATVLVRR